MQLLMPALLTCWDLQKHLGDQSLFSQISLIWECSYCGQIETFSTFTQLLNRSIIGSFGVLDCKTEWGYVVIQYLCVWFVYFSAWQSLSSQGYSNWHLWPSFHVKSSILRYYVIHNSSDSSQLPWQTLNSRLS